jgi:hypothetical protein
MIFGRTTAVDFRTAAGEARQTPDFDALRSKTSPGSLPRNYWNRGHVCSLTEKREGKPGKDGSPLRTD